MVSKIGWLVPFHSQISWLVVSQEVLIFWSHRQPPTQLPDPKT
uniref:Uncharacterized protein n=1 Tax=Romanomermis culicivorax TaxID=13658 RepID=A0A915L1K4_ROMCU